MLFFNVYLLHRLSLINQNINLDDHKLIVKEFHIYQYYPNQFGKTFHLEIPTTKLKYDIQNKIFITQRTLNFIVQQVATLIKEHKAALQMKLILMNGILRMYFIYIS